MMNTKLILPFLLSIFLMTGTRAEQARIMIMGDRVNLRNGASLESEVVGQVNYGDELTAVEIGEEWVRVRPPASVPMWVHSGLIFEEREVRARVLNVRGGPGTQFASLGMLSRGDTVQVLESVEEWRRISAPDGISVFVSREFVHIPPAPQVAEQDVIADTEEAPAEAPLVEEAAEAPPEALEPAPVEDPATEDSAAVSIEVEGVESLPATPEQAERFEEPAETPSAVEELVEMPENVPLVPLPGQGTVSVRRGWVRAYLIAGSSPSRFHLVHRQGSLEQTLCYLQGDEEVLRRLSGQEVQVRGRDFWVAGQRMPLTRIETIEPLELRPE